MTQFAGKIAFVSGGASGIGLATARRFAQQGAIVALADLRADAVRAAARELGCGCTALVLDVGDPIACEQAVEEVVLRHGALDIAVNNAAIPSQPVAKFEDFPVEEWDRLISVNLSGVFYAMRAQIRQMRKQGSGAIVNTASVSSVIAAPGMPAYTAAKHGVAGLTKVAALDLAETGIRVNAVCPGFVHTGMTDPVLKMPGAAADLIGKTPLGRVAQPDEIASAILFLASDEASFATGSMVMLDGGLSIY